MSSVISYSQATDETHDLVYWPVLRWANKEFLRSVHKFYVYYDKGHNALLVTRGNPKVYALGENTHGCLGLGHLNKVTTPTEVVELSGKNVIQCACGVAFVMVLTEEGELYGFGWNYCGQVNSQHPMVSRARKTDNDKNITRPYLIMNHVIMVACGSSFTTALRRNGTVWCWGENFARPKGKGNCAFYQTPPVQMIGPLDGSRVVQIDCSFSNCIALTDHNQIYYWNKLYDKNINGLQMVKAQEFLLPSNFTITSITAIGTGYFILTRDGQVYHSNYMKMLPKLLEFDELVRAIVTLEYSTFLQFQSTYVAIYDGYGCCRKVKHTTLTSLADAFAFYGDSVTPGLTTLSERAINSLHTINFFNDPSTSDFKFAIGRKFIYLNRSIASQRSPFLAEKFSYTYYSTHFGDNRFSFVVWFTFLRYLLTDTLVVIERDLAFDLLALTIQSGTHSFRDLCLHSIIHHLPTANQTPKLPTHLVGFPASLTMANGSYFYQLAEEANDQLKQKQILQFVATQSLSTALEVMDELRVRFGESETSQTESFPRKYYQSMTQNFNKKGLITLLHHSKLSPVALRYLANTMTMENCIPRFRLATKNEINELETEIVKFVANLDDLFSFCKTASFNVADGALTKNLLIQATKFRDDLQRITLIKRKADGDEGELTGSVIKCQRGDDDSISIEEYLSSTPPSSPSSSSDY